MAGRYFYHRVTHELKIIYAYETAEGYEGNDQWWEWSRPPDDVSPRIARQFAEERSAILARLAGLQPRVEPPPLKRRTPVRATKPTKPTKRLIPLAAIRNMPLTPELAAIRNMPAPRIPVPKVIMAPATVVSALENFGEVCRSTAHSLLMAAEGAHQRNLTDIVEQRFTRRLRERFPLDDDD